MHYSDCKVLTHTLSRGNTEGQPWEGELQQAVGLQVARVGVLEVLTGVRPHLLVGQAIHEYYKHAISRDSA